VSIDIGRFKNQGVSVDIYSTMTSFLSELHDPLVDGHIRLLELNLEREHDVVGRLRTVELTSAPAYYALSYVCGVGPYDHEVSIDDAVVKVKPNLYTALRRLQSYFRWVGKPQLLIWVDAICIDQDNAEEKAKQMRNMHDIYSKAEKVLVSLGSVPRDVHLVLSTFSWVEAYTSIDPLIRSTHLERLELVQESGHREAWGADSDPDLQLTGDLERLEYLTQQLKTRHGVDVQSLLAMKTLLERLELFGIWGGYHVSWGSLEEKQKLALDFPGSKRQLFGPNHSFWAGVYALSEIEWYQRVWTYQEIALAKDAKLFAEGLSVDWKSVVAPTIGLLWALNDDTMFAEIDAEKTIVGLPTHADRATWYMKWSQVIVPGERMRSLCLLETLIITRIRKSTVAKDKVYGLLALVRSEVRAQIPIDYTATDGEVFAHAVKEGLKEAPAMKISLLWEFFDEVPSAMEDLPSWCPDFASTSGSVDPIWHHGVPSAVRQHTLASSHYEHYPGFQIIGVNVLKLDTIARCMDIACPLDYSSQFSFPSDSEASHTLEAALKQWLLQIQATFSDDDSSTGLGCDMTKFLHGKYGHRSSLPIETFGETLNRMLLLCNTDQQRPCAHDRLRDWPEYRHTLTILSRQSNRYLFETTSGKIGFSTRRPTPGNHIVLLPGSVRMHMLTRDCTQYSGCISLAGMAVDVLFGLVIIRELTRGWEMVQLR
jgi:hypothetical protein